MEGLLAAFAKNQNLFEAVWLWLPDTDDSYEHPKLLCTGVSPDYSLPVVLWGVILVSLAKKL